MTDIKNAMDLNDVYALRRCFFDIRNEADARIVEGFIYRHDSEAALKAKHAAKEAARAIIDAADTAYDLTIANLKAASDGRILHIQSLS